VASLSQGRTAAAQCGLFTHKSVPVIFEPPCTNGLYSQNMLNVLNVTKDIQNYTGVQSAFTRKTAQRRDVETPVSDTLPSTCSTPKFFSAEQCFKVTPEIKIQRG